MLQKKNVVTFQFDYENANRLITKTTKITKDERDEEIGARDKAPPQAMEQANTCPIFSHRDAFGEHKTYQKERRGSSKNKNKNQK